MTSNVAKPILRDIYFMAQQSHEMDGPTFLISTALRSHPSSPFSKGNTPELCESIYKYIRALGLMASERYRASYFGILRR